MPKSLHPDIKDLAKALYLQGFMPAQIAEKMADRGVSQPLVRKWANRDRWGELRDQTKNAVAQGQIKSVAIEVAQDINAASKRVRAGLSKEIQAQVAVLEQNPPTGILELSGRNGRAALAKTVAETAGMTYGWDAQTSNTLVNINVLSQPIDNLTVESEVIDVEPDPKP